MRISPWSAVLLTAALASAGVVLERGDELPAPAAEPVPVTAPARSGMATCAVGRTDAGARTEVIAAASPAHAGASAVDVRTFADGVAASAAELVVRPGTAVKSPLDEGTAAVGMVVRWWDTPTAIARVWETSGRGEPAGYVAGPCPSGPSDAWLVPGLGTAGGAAAELHLANPFATDASVEIRLLTPDGPLDPTRLRNVTVAARSTTRVRLNDHAPERADLAALITTRSGRVVAEAVQSVDAAIGGVEGISLASATDEPSTTWTVPWAAVVGEEVVSWMWIANPGERPAAVDITIHTEEGGAVPEGLDELVVEPGTVQRVDLVDAFPDGVETAAVTVRSENGVPVGVSVGSEYRSEDSERTGIAVQLGAPVVDDRWVLSDVPPAGRDVDVSIANPTSEPARIEMSVWDGQRLRTVPGLADPLGPGRFRVVSLDRMLERWDALALSVFVEATDGEVVAGWRSFDTVGTRRLVVAAGVPSILWSSTRSVPLVVADPALTRTLGTGLGVSPPDPLRPMPAPSPSLFTPTPSASPG